MESLLTSIGLTDLQAHTYLKLLQNGPSTPPQLTKNLKITRTNTYKVLDGLVELGLVSKTVLHKKLTYFPEDPIALSSLVAEERNKVIALEQNTKSVVFELRRKYRRSSSRINIKTYKGKVAVRAVYEYQASLKQPMYFIKTRADIPVMGFETMDQVRRLAKTLNFKRYGITPDSPEGSINPALDKDTNLKRTWVDERDYPAPVEWAVAGDELNIFVFDKKPQVIQIKNSTVAEAFTQLWKLLDKNLRANPEYKKMPRKAKRKV